MSLADPIGVDLRGALRRLQAGDTFTEDEAASLVGGFLAEEDDAAFAGFLAALAQRGETGPEIAGAARALRAAMTPFAADGLGRAVDTCGTGGDGLGTFNVSTAAALVAAGAGVRVVKHGNRAVSSRSGSADVLEALGGRVDVDAEVARRALEESGFTFLFAPRYHPAMKRAARVRRALGVRTVFNLTGPLCNPAGVARQVVGVAAARFVGPVADALERLGAHAAFVVHGAEGADELTLSGPQTCRAVASAPASMTRAFATGAAGLGLLPAGVEALEGGDAAQNARIVRRILSGERGPRRDVVALNAAAAIALGREGVADAADALALADESIASGVALRALETYAAVTGGAS